ncbi:MAG: hypothetical protein HY819_20280 [Acidobacteria bacterium]|nr:hypothetical protein [Acidobacteriota bacterium]
MLKPFFKKFIKPIESNQKGATLLIAALILALLTVFVSTALINSSSSGISINNDANTKNSFYVSYAALEMMSKEFSDIFTANLSPTKAQLDTIKAHAELLANSSSASERIANGMNLKTDIRKGDFLSTGVTLTNGPYSGLRALREEYVFTATSTTNSGVTVQLTRSLYNNLIPIFQFGIFSTRHLEFYNGPPFNFGGRVHANRDIYLTPGGQTTFADRVTTTGQITYGKLRNGADRAVTAGNVRIFFPPAAQNRNLTLGSVINGPDIPGDPRPGHPAGTSNKTNFDSFVQTNLPGQVFFKAPALRLPIQNTGNRPIEIIRRGLTGEDPTTSILAQSRFYNKAGLRISLGDEQTDLPGGGGIRLDSPTDPTTNTTYSDGRLGYIPKSLGSYQASRVNGHRLKGWIKIETLQRQADGSILTTDVTAPILALGITSYEQLPLPTPPALPIDQSAIRAMATLSVPTTGGFTNFTNGRANFSNLDDSKSIFRLQRYSLAPNPSNTVITRSDTTGPYTDNMTQLSGNRNNLIAAGTIGGAPTLTNPLATPPVFPLVDNVADTPGNSDTPAAIYPGGTIPATTTPPAPAKTKVLPAGMLIAYPINMYDQREGGALDTDPGPDNLHLNGVFSVIDIDMGNLKRLLTGGFDTDFSNGGFAFRANTISSESNGWIIYISDRRGDSYNKSGSPTLVVQQNNYGKYDMETIYGNTTSATTRQPYIPGAGQTLFEIEDTNDNGTIEFPSSANQEGALPDEYIDRIDAITRGPIHPNTLSSNTGSIGSSAALFNTTANGGNATYTRVRQDSPGAVQVPLFRRAVRLSNAMDLTQAAQTATDKPLNLNRGITIACENAVYVQGNYNTSGVSSAPPNTAANYQGNEVPAAIISDSVTLLSTDWKDVSGFNSPYDVNGRVPSNTQYRFAAFTGRTRDGLFVGSNDTVRWGTLGTTGTIGPEKDDVRLYGGVHNFLRYLEDWGGRNISYCGSIIDGWDSFQANGTFKCCTTVYDAPNRDYTFNTAFQNVDRLPPGTPNLQYILFTNFRENVNPKQF